MAKEKKEKGKAKKNYFAAYSPAAQRRKRLERELNRQPNNQQVVDAIERLGKAKNEADAMRKRPPKQKLGWVDRRDPDFMGDPNIGRDPVHGRVEAETMAWAAKIDRKDRRRASYGDNGRKYRTVKRNGSDKTRRAKGKGKKTKAA